MRDIELIHQLSPDWGKFLTRAPQTGHTGTLSLAYNDLFVEGFLGLERDESLLALAPLVPIAAAAAKYAPVAVTAAPVVVRGANAVARSGVVRNAANVVYRGIDAVGKVRYVGITGREPAKRFAEHAASGTARAPLQYRVVDGATGLTRTQARIWEQGLINQHGLGRNGGQLLNMRNSIAPQNWQQFVIQP